MFQKWRNCVFLFHVANMRMVVKFVFKLDLLEKRVYVLKYRF